MNWYTGNTTFDTALTIAFGIVILTTAASFFMQTPYGRFQSDKYGISMSPRLGWFLMELPASISFLYFYLTGPNAAMPVPMIFFIIWCIHYANRGFLFPFLIRVQKGSKQTFSLMVVMIGWSVTILHGSMNGSYFSTFGDHYTTDWFTDPRFIIGIIIYYSGFILNLHSDHIIRNLRPKDGRTTDGGPRYKIPTGGLFRYVSCPQYLSELIAWTGFAVFTWSLPGLFILTISLANLVPRALATHKWYRQNFADYPGERKALIPFIL